MEFVDNPNLSNSPEASYARMLQEKYLQMLLEQSFESLDDAGRIQALLQYTKMFNLNVNTALYNNTVQVKTNKLEMPNLKPANQDKLNAMLNSTFDSLDSGFETDRRNLMENDARNVPRETERCHFFTSDYQETCSQISPVKNHEALNKNENKEEEEDTLQKIKKASNHDATLFLKTWLFEHRKEPYPTKEEKILLARVTRMNLTQISTWFANARRRLKKENRMTWNARKRTISVCEIYTNAGNSQRDNYQYENSSRWNPLKSTHQLISEPSRLSMPPAQVVQNEVKTTHNQHQQFLEIYLNLVNRCFNPQVAALTPSVNNKSASKIWSLAEMALGRNSTSQSANICQPTMEFRYPL